MPVLVSTWSHVAKKIRCEFVARAKVTYKPRRVKHVTWNRIIMINKYDQLSGIAFVLLGVFNNLPVKRRFVALLGCQRIFAQIHCAKQLFAKKL